MFSKSSMNSSSDKKEPPSCIDSYYPNWQELNNTCHAYSKSFHFTNLNSISDFCLSLLLCPHKENSRITALENKISNNVRVDISIPVENSQSNKKETLDLIKLIEQFYEKCQTRTANNKEKHFFFIFKR